MSDFHDPRSYMGVAPDAPQRALSVLVVHEELPALDRNSGSLRLHRYIELMVADGHKVTVVALAGNEKPSHSDELRALGVEVHACDYGGLRRAGLKAKGIEFELPLLLARGRFDIAYLYFHMTAERYLPDIRALSPATRIVVDSVDVHYVRERRGAAISGDPVALLAAEETRQREAAIYSQADVLVAVSDEDAVALREIAPDVPVEVLPNVHLNVATGGSFGSRSGLVFVANFTHTPNVDAIIDFHRTSWPLIVEAIPEAKLTVVGYDPPPEITALEDDRVIVTGQVPDVAPYLDTARVSIAPLRFGAGVKGKVGEAMIHGLPVVTTPIGAEGMGLVDGEHALIADPGEDFARAVVRLHSDPLLWERLSSAARLHVEQQQGHSTALQSLRRTLVRAVPACFLARVPRWSAESASAIIDGYLAAFSEGDPVSLVVPMQPGDQTEDDVMGLLAEAIDRAGADPEHVPDIAVHPSFADPPLPSRAIAVDADCAGELNWQAAAAAALASEWTHGSQWPSPPPTPGAPRASIVIPAYGKREMTELCLAALDHHLGDRLGDEIELVLVDNHSPDSTLELFEQWSDRATVVALPENMNFAGGINAGARAANGQVLIVVSTDMELGAGAIDAMIDEVSKPGVGLVGARMRYPDGRLQHAGISWRKPESALEHFTPEPFHIFHFEDGDLSVARATVALNTVTGGCIAVRADLFELVGGFDEGYVNGWEDCDLCLQIKSTGAGVRCIGDLDIVHHEGITSGGNYNTQGNLSRFWGRWGTALGGDGRLVGETYGAIMNPLAGVGVPETQRTGARLQVVGPILGLDARGAEARGLLRALRDGGVDVAARTVAPTWVGPRLDEARWRELFESHTRASAPDPTSIVFGDGAGGRSIVRVGLAERPVPAAESGKGSTAWAASPAAADRLLRAGWAPEAIELVAPAGIESAPGPGGDGVLLLVPTHDPGLTAKLLDALPELGAGPVSVLPSVRTPDIYAQLKTAMPGAKLLEPTTDEQELASLGARFDLVVAVDPDDEFDRQALSAAGSGAAVIVRPDGPAAWVLGELASVVDLDNQPLSVAINAGRDGSPAARSARISAVSDLCGIEASGATLRELLAPTPGRLAPTA